MSTWISTWPGDNNRPAYTAHDTEQQAEAHAKQIIDSGTARVATFYEIDGLETTA